MPETPAWDGARDRLPGVGGLYIDTTGAVTVLAPVDSTVDQVQASVARNADLFELPEELQAQLTSGNVKVLPAEYPFSYLTAWKEMIGPLAQTIDGMTMIDADERSNRVTIGVVDSTALQRIRDAAMKLHVPVAAMQFKLRGYAKPLSGAMDTKLYNGFTAPLHVLIDTTLQSQFAALRGGIQYATITGTCTIGFVVWPNRLLSAAHCAPNPGAGGGGNIYQPVCCGVQNLSGTIYSNPPWHVNDPKCRTPGTQCTDADVMSMTSTFRDYRFWVARTKAYGSITVDPANRYWLETGRYSTTSVGMGVDFMGAYSGWKHGTVARTNIVIHLDGYDVIHSDELDGDLAQEGDSGSPVFVGNFAIGILFAGGCDPVDCGTDFNNFSQIDTHLGGFIQPY